MRTITTERLVLRLLQAEDVPAFAAYRRRPEPRAAIAACAS